MEGDLWESGSVKKLGVEIEECWRVYLVCPIHMIAREIMVQILTFRWGRRWRRRGWFGLVLLGFWRLRNSGLGLFVKDLGLWLVEQDFSPHNLLRL